MKPLTEPRIVGRTAMFGKSYMWVLTVNGLELHPDFVQRSLFSNGERRQMERWSRTGFTQ